MTAPYIAPTWWQATPPNRLPVDPDTGGLAAMIGWWTAGGGSTSTAAVMLNPGDWVSTRLAGNPSTPVPVSAGSRHRFSATGAGPVVAELYGVATDGSLRKLAAAFTPAGGTRFGVEAHIPSDCPYAAVYVILPATYTAPAGEADLVSHAVYTDLLGAAVSLPTGATVAPVAAAFVMSGPVLVQGSFDPGPVPPTSASDTFGATVYYDLPELYRTVDGQQTVPVTPLYSYLQGAGSEADSVNATATLVYEGALTDPVACPDAWLPWLAVVTGAPWGPTPADTRAAIAGREGGAPIGSRQNLEQYVRQYLTGTKSVSVVPAAGTPWTLNVTMISAETTAAGGPAAIVAKLMGSGQVPAGWVCVGVLVNPTWAGHNTAFPLWSSWNGKTWTDHNSAGL